MLPYRLPLPKSAKRNLAFLCGEAPPLIFAVASTSWLSVVRGAGLVERRGLNRAHSVTFLKRLYSYYRAALEPIGKELIVFGCHIDHAACDSNCGSYVNA